jgi:hypothetical protein
MDSKYKGPAVLRPDLIHKATEKHVVELLAENEKLKAQLDRAIKVADPAGNGCPPNNGRFDYEDGECISPVNCGDCVRKYIMEGE